MSVSSSFLWRFLDDVWDLLPSEDRALFETYWMGFVRAGGDFQKKIYEGKLSLMVETVPVYLTDRWERFVMNDGTADLLTVTDQIPLFGMASGELTYSTAFYDVVVVTSASGNIRHSEQVQFFDDSVKPLRYGNIVANTTSVRIAEIEYTEGRDYAVNIYSGQISRTPTSRIPKDIVTTVRYVHESYVLGLDYSIDEIGNSISRVAGTSIVDTSTVYVTYQYNATTTIPLSGETGTIESSLVVLTDINANFSGVTSGKTLTVLGGPNAGSYTVLAVLSKTSLQINEVFQSAVSGGILYTIDIFPHAMRVDSSIVSIPTLRNLVDSSSVVLVEGVDYRVFEGVLASRSPFPMQSIGPAQDRDRVMWAEEVKVNDQTPYRNFGVLIDFFRENSEEYKLALQGLWYTFWTGSTDGNLITGMHILLGLPFAKRGGTVIEVTATQIKVKDSRGQVLIYVIPSDLTAIVATGDAVNRFDRLVNGVEIFTRVNDPGFVSTKVGRTGIQDFLTSNATRGIGDTDETKALTLLENHLFLPRIIQEAVTQIINVKELRTFLDNLKPQWTEYIFSFSVSEDDSLTVSEDAGDLSVVPTINLTTSLNSNEFNQAEAHGSYLLSGLNGRTIGTGTQATGNFEDASVDFAVSGIGKGALVKIDSGTFVGIWLVLKRVSATVLSIDIPDANIAELTGLGWSALTEEQSRLNHDSPTLGDGGVILDGTQFLVPAVLNTKSDAPFSSTNLGDEDVKEMLLLDIANVGAEVQGITASDILTGELNVPVAPAVAATVHRVASVSIVRTNNVGVVTDVNAI